MTDQEIIEQVAEWLDDWLDRYRRVQFNSEKEWEEWFHGEIKEFLSLIRPLIEQELRDKGWKSPEEVGEIVDGFIKDGIEYRKRDAQQAREDAYREVGDYIREHAYDGKQEIAHIVDILLKGESLKSGLPIKEG